MLELSASRVDDVCSQVRVIHRNRSPKAKLYLNIVEVRFEEKAREENGGKVEVGWGRGPPRRAATTVPVSLVSRQMRQCSLSRDTGEGRRAECGVGKQEERMISVRRALHLLLMIDSSGYCRRQEGLRV